MRLALLAVMTVVVCASWQPWIGLIGDSTIIDLSDAA